MHIKPQTLISPLLVALLLGTTVASADPDHEGKQGKFMKFFDTNADGIVTYEEFQGSSKNRFDRIDTDGNGTISPAEFTAYMQSRREERHKNHFENTDTNKDGVVSKDEFLSASQERALRRFSRMDKNDDGLLSADELAAHKMHKPRFGKKIFSRLDANGDGQVTQEESQAAWGKWFKRLDTNGDQVVSSEEIAQARARWQD